MVGDVVEALVPEVYHYITGQVDLDFLKLNMYNEKYGTVI